jgi:hypothetical protein
VLRWRCAASGLKLRNQVRYVLYEGSDFRLARHWHLGTHCMHFLGGGADEDATTTSTTTIAPAARAPTAIARARAAVLAEAGATPSSVVPAKSALEALANLGVDASIFFRRTHPRAGGRRNATGTAATGRGSSLQLARQCPFDARVRLYCPWLSPVCPARLRATILDVEAAAQAAIRATTRLPPWRLFGDKGDLEDARTEGRLVGRLNSTRDALRELARYR